MALITSDCVPPQTTEQNAARVIQRAIRGKLGRGAFAIANLAQQQLTKVSATKLQAFFRSGPAMAMLPFVDYAPQLAHIHTRTHTRTHPHFHTHSTVPSSRPVKAKRAHTHTLTRPGAAGLGRSASSSSR